jgi:riboflavin kinase/FMN adenylyltransferase
LELLSTQCVDLAYVCRFNYALAQTSSEEFVRRILVEGLRVRWLLVGDDFRFGARRAGDIVLLRQYAARYGYEVEAMSSVTMNGERISSTAVRDALAGGELARAARLLGRPYSISGRVVEGDRLGRRLGFPTANIQMRHNRPPLSGIFVVEVTGVRDRPVDGVASLGVRPTVKARGTPVLEAHLLDFDEDLYGRHLRVDFLHKLRDERKFADLDTLTRQIGCDADNARDFFRRRRADAPRTARS